MITIAKHKVEITGINTSEIKVLTDKEKEELFIRLKNGDMAAKDELANGNLKLVLSILRKYQNRCDNMDDLFQVGCIGLMKAIDNFDLSQNVKFSTYAVPMIIGEIRRYLRDNNPIRVSRSMRDVAYKALQVRDSLVNRFSREPSINEIAEELKMPREEIVFALDAIQEPISLFEPIYHDGGDPIFVMDQISDKKNKEENWIEYLSLNDALDTLSPRESHIIKLRFFEGKTQMEVASEIQISQAQVSRLEKNALKSMERYLTCSTCH